MTVSKENSDIELRVTQGAIDGIVTAIAAAMPLCFTAPWSEKTVRAALESPAATALTAWQGETLCGFLLLDAVADEGEIADLAVLPAFRRRGIARAMLMRGLDLFRETGITHVFLEVRRANVAAQALYASAGFQPVGVRKNYYQFPQEDAFLYRLAFEESVNHDNEDSRH